MSNVKNIENIEQLEVIYGFPGETSTVKVTSHLTSDYRAFVEASPFLALATSGPEGLEITIERSHFNIRQMSDQWGDAIPKNRRTKKHLSCRSGVFLMHSLLAATRGFWASAKLLEEFGEFGLLAIHATIKP